MWRIAVSRWDHGTTHPLAHLQKGHQLPVDQHRLTFHSNLRQFSSFFWLAIGYLPLGPDPHVSSTALNWPLRIILRTWNFEIRLSSHRICPHFCLKPDCFLGLNGHLNFEIFTGHNLGKGLDKTDLRKSIYFSMIHGHINSYQSFAWSRISVIFRDFGAKILKFHGCFFISRPLHVLVWELVAFLARCLFFVSQFCI